MQGTIIKPKIGTKAFILTYKAELDKYFNGFCFLCPSGISWWQSSLRHDRAPPAHAELGIPAEPSADSAGSEPVAVNAVKRAEVFWCNFRVKESLMDASGIHERLHPSCPGGQFAQNRPAGLSRRCSIFSETYVCENMVHLLDSPAAHVALPHGVY